MVHSAGAIFSSKVPSFQVTLINAKLKITITTTVIIAHRRPRRHCSRCYKLRISRVFLCPRFHDSSVSRRALCWVYCQPFAYRYRFPQYCRSSPIAKHILWRVLLKKSLLEVEAFTAVPQTALPESFTVPPSWEDSRNSIHLAMECVVFHLRCMPCNGFVEVLVLTHFTDGKCSHSLAHNYSGRV